MFKLNTKLMQISIWVLLVLLICSILPKSTIHAVGKRPTYKIITYLPLWKKWQADDIDAQKLAHINLAFAGIRDGVIVDSLTPDQSKIIRKVKQKNHLL